MPENALLSITAPGLFPNPERFRETFARPVEKGDAGLLARLRLRIRPLMMQLSLHPALIGEDGSGGSSKIDLLVEQLQDVTGSGHRALVFGQFTGFLAHVCNALDAAGVCHAYLDGTSRDREGIIDAFQQGSVPVFLISLKAGGFGLNLTEADYCFLLDPWWNPATETQAVDRTRRIGQDRTVMVYRLIPRPPYRGMVWRWRPGK